MTADYRFMLPDDFMFSMNSQCDLTPKTYTAFSEYEFAEKYLAQGFHFGEFEKVGGIELEETKWMLYEELQNRSIAYSEI